MILIRRSLFGALPLALFLISLHVCAPAFAADAVQSGVTIAWGDLLAQGLASIQAATVAALVYVVSRWVPAILKPVLTDQLLKHALDYGFAATEGAVKGEVLTVPVANEAIRQAAQYAADNGPKWLLTWLGDTIEPKLIARLSGMGALPPEAHAANLTG